jgi:hypothetical protein
MGAVVQFAVSALVPKIPSSPVPAEDTWASQPHSPAGEL